MVAAYLHVLSPSNAPFDIYCRQYRNRTSYNEVHICRSGKKSKWQQIDGLDTGKVKEMLGNESPTERQNQVGERQRCVGIKCKAVSIDNKYICVGTYGSTALSLLNNSMLLLLARQSVALNTQYITVRIFSQFIHWPLYCILCAYLSATRRALVSCVFHTAQATLDLAKTQTTAVVVQTLSAR